MTMGRSVGGPSSMTMGRSGWWSIKYDYGTVGLVVHQV